MTPTHPHQLLSMGPKPPLTGEAGRQADPCPFFSSLPFLADAIINENYTYLKGFLEDLASPKRCSLIQGWDTAGLVFLDYLQVIEMVSRIQQVRWPVGFLTL